MWEAVVGGGLSLAGGLLGADAAEDAADAQTRAAEAGIGEQRRQFDVTRRDFAPQRNLGKAATYRLGELLGLETDETGPGGRIPVGAKDVTTWARERGYDLPQGREWMDSELQNLYAGGYQKYLDQFRAANPVEKPSEFGALSRKFTMDDMNADPVMKASFDFGLSEGEKAVRRMFGAKGLARSGAAVKALTRYATDYTNTKAGDAYNRFYADQDRTFNRLTGVSGLGQTANTTVANLGAHTADNIANLTVGAGNARGAAGIAGANAMGGAFSGIGNQVYGQYTLDRILNRDGINPAARRFSFDQFANNDFAVG